jgi:hypothetical protein
MTKNIKLSSEAITALLNTHDRQGAIVQAPRYVLAELSRVALIGVGGGLTRAGLIRRGIETEKQFAELF